MATFILPWRESQAANEAYKSHIRQYDGLVEDKEWGDEESSSEEPLDTDMAADDDLQRLLKTFPTGQ